MNTRTAKLTAIATVAIAAAILASPWVMAATSTNSISTTSTSTSTSNTSSSQGYASCGPGHGFGRGFDRQGPPIYGNFGFQNTANLTIGQAITVTSAQGRFRAIGTTNDTGTASGAVTFTVTSKLAEGYALSITSGSIVVGGTTYTISSGTAQTGPYADVIQGQGTTTPAGQFLLRGFARGSFGGTTGSILLDLKAGSTEYAVALVGTVTS